MNELKVKVTGDSVGFDQALAQAREQAKKFAQSVPQSWSSQASNPAAFLSKQSQQALQEHEGGFHALAEKAAGKFGEIGHLAMKFASGPMGAVSAAIGAAADELVAFLKEKQLL